MGKWDSENAESPTHKHKKRYSTTRILGKRLFSDEFDENDEQKGTKHQPIPVSPDVQVLGERSFNGSCSSMVNTTDNLYNTKLSLGTSSSGKENLPPKDNTPNKVVVLMDKTTLFLGQLGDSFGATGHVEAYVFNVFCRMLFQENHPRRSKMHYFFTTLGDYFLQNWKSKEGRREMKRKALRSFNGAGKALSLHESDRIFFPSVHAEHWFLFVVDIIARKFVFLDSYYEGNTPFHIGIRDLMINNFIKTWEDSNLRGMGFIKFGVEYPNMPKQIGSDAFGIFALNWMQTWAS